MKFNALPYDKYIYAQLKFIWHVLFVRKPKSWANQSFSNVVTSQIGLFDISSYSKSNVGIKLTHGHQQFDTRTEICNTKWKEKKTNLKYSILFIFILNWYFVSEWNQHYFMLLFHIKFAHNSSILLSLQFINLRNIRGGVIHSNAFKK